MERIGSNCRWSTSCRRITPALDHSRKLTLGQLRFAAECTGMMLSRRRIAVASDALAKRVILRQRLRDWMAAAKLQRHARTTLLRSIVCWRSVILRSALSRWREAIDEIKGRMLYALSLLSLSLVTSGFRRWVSVTLADRLHESRQERRARRQFCRHLRSRTFKRWLSNVEAKKRQWMYAAMGVAKRHYFKVTGKRFLQHWIAKTSFNLILRPRLLRCARRLSLNAMEHAFLRWRDVTLCVAEAEATGMRRALAHSNSRFLTCAFEAWATLVHHELVYRLDAVRRWRVSTLSGVVGRWREWVAERGTARRVAQGVLARWTFPRLAAGFERWIEATRRLPPVAAWRVLGKPCACVAHLLATKTRRRRRRHISNRDSLNESSALHMKTSSLGTSLGNHSRTAYHDVVDTTAVLVKSLSQWPHDVEGNPKASDPDSNDDKISLPDTITTHASSVDSQGRLRHIADWPGDVELPVGTVDDATINLVRSGAFGRSGIMSSEREISRRPTVDDDAASYDVSDGSAITDSDTDTDDDTDDGPICLRTVMRRHRWRVMRRARRHRIARAVCGDFYLEDINAIDGDDEVSSDGEDALLPPRHDGDVQDKSFTTVGLQQRAFRLQLRETSSRLLHNWNARWLRGKGSKQAGDNTKEMSLRFGIEHLDGCDKCFPCTPDHHLSRRIQAGLKLSSISLKGEVSTQSKQKEPPTHSAPVPTHGNVIARFRLQRRDENATLDGQEIWRLQEVMCEDHKMNTVERPMMDSQSLHHNITTPPLASIIEVVPPLKAREVLPAAGVPGEESEVKGLTDDAIPNRQRRRRDTTVTSRFLLRPMLTWRDGIPTLTTGVRRTYSHATRHYRETRHDTSWDHDTHHVTFVPENMAALNIERRRQQSRTQQREQLRQQRRDEQHNERNILEKTPGPEEPAVMEREYASFGATATTTSDDGVTTYLGSTFGAYDEHIDTPLTVDNNSSPVTPKIEPRCHQVSYVVDEDSTLPCPNDYLRMLRHRGTRSVAEQKTPSEAVSGDSDSEGANGIGRNRPLHENSGVRGESSESSLADTQKRHSALLGMLESVYNEHDALSTDAATDDHANVGLQSPKPTNVDAWTRMQVEGYGRHFALLSRMEDTYSVAVLDALEDALYSENATRASATLVSSTSTLPLPPPLTGAPVLSTTAFRTHETDENLINHDGTSCSGSGDDNDGSSDESFSNSSDSGSYDSSDSDGSDYSSSGSDD